MNLIIQLISILLAVSLNQALPSRSPQVIGKKPSTTAQPLFPIDDPPKQLNMIAPNGLLTNYNERVWNNMITRLLLLRRGAKIRNVISIKFDDLPPPTPTKASTTTTGAIAGASAMRFLSIGNNRPQAPPGSSRSKKPAATARADITREEIPITDDVGACSTIVNEAERLVVGHMYFPRSASTKRKVRLAVPLAVRGISCRSSKPSTGSGKEKCVVVGYPHGAWVRVPPSELYHHNQGNCRPISNDTSDKMCWDYIVVPGYCAMTRGR